MDYVRTQIKKTIFYKIYLALKIRKDLFYYINLIKRMKVTANNSEIYLVGTVLHRNLGDHLISYAETSFLYEIFNGTKHIVQIPIEVYVLFSKKIERNIPDEALVCINGGGWMGDVWPENELLMQSIVKSFSNHKIIIFPQTIYYKNEKGDLARKAKDVYDNAKDITICVRDENSYIYAKDAYCNANIVLMPDIALSLKEENIIFDTDDGRTLRHSIGVCIRNDRELEDNGKMKEALNVIQTDPNNDGKIIDVSTIAAGRIREKERKLALQRLMGKYKQCELVITNRLHSMILCYLTKTPCIAFDNSTHKVSGTYYKWLHDCSGIRYGNDMSNDQIIDFITKSINNDVDFSAGVRLDFAGLYEVIINGNH